MLRSRTPFHGRSSPVSLSWGRFDLHHARFPRRPDERDAVPTLLPDDDLRAQVDPDTDRAPLEGNVPGRAP